MTYPASVIAYAFAKRGIDENILVTQMKLQKMVYFAHGYHLAKYGEPLITETFQAWQYGPVIQSIYHHFKAFGSSPITSLNYEEYSSLLERYPLTGSAKDAIDYTWRITSNLTALSLSNWTHEIGSPWERSYDPSVREKPIENEEIGKYFTTLLSA